MTVTKYLTIADALRVRCGELTIGAQLPSEAELAREFEVSRMTVRQALDQLERAGLISRTPGIGTFVQDPPVQKGATLTSFTEDMQARHLQAAARVIGIECRNADLEVAHDLQLRGRERMLVIERLRMAGGQPICLETAQLPARFEKLLNQQDLETSLHAALRAVGVYLANGTRTIRARVMLPREARLLLQPNGAPALEITHVFRDARGAPVQRARSLYRADRYEVVTEVQRSESAASLADDSPH